MRSAGRTGRCPQLAQLIQTSFGTSHWGLRGSPRVVFDWPRVNWTDSATRIPLIQRAWSTRGHGSHPFGDPRKVTGRDINKRLVQLYEGSLDRSVHVIPRRDTDPEAARASDRVESSGEQVIAVDQGHGPQAWSTCATSHRIGSKLARAPARVMCGRASGLRSIASKASRLRHCA